MTAFRRCRARLATIRGLLSALLPVRGDLVEDGVAAARITCGEFARTEAALLGSKHWSARTKLRIKLGDRDMLAAAARERSKEPSRSASKQLRLVG